MDWTRTMAEERAALGRIAALLCALAGLAERAAGRSAIVRCVVLTLLRRAEWAARDFVGGDTATMPILPAGNAPSDAQQFAAHLRALARHVDRQALLLACLDRDACDRAASPRPALTPAIAQLRHRLSAILASAFGWPFRVLAPDTS